MKGTSRKAWKCAGAGMVVAATAAMVLAAGGSFDTTFGAGGVVLIGAGSVDVDGLAVQPDGKTVECNRFNTGRVNELGGAIYEWQVRRFALDGSLDSSFGTGGLVRLLGDTDGGPLYPVTSSKPRALVQDAVGRTIVVGNSAVKTVTVTGTGRKAKTTYSWLQYATLVRIQANGALDTSFGTGGVVRTAVPGTGSAGAYDVVLQPDGCIVITGTAYTADSTWNTGVRYDVFIARYIEGGSLDTTFGTGGITVDPRAYPGRGYQGMPNPRGVALQSTGHVVLAEMRGTGALWNVARFTSSGAMDTGFAAISAPDSLCAIAVDRFDRIVGTGETPNVNSASDMRVARYLPDGSADASFGSGGVVIINAYQRERALSSARFQPLDDKIVFGASVGPVGAAVQVATTLRLTDAGVLDSTYGSSGIGPFVTGSANGTDVALAPGGMIVLGGNMFSPSSLFLARYLGN